MNLSLRPMTLKDLEACIPLFMAAFAQPPWNETHDEAQTRRYFENFFQMDACLAFLCLADGKPVALSLGMAKPWIKGVEYFIDLFCVDPAWQRQGVGSWFLKALADHLTPQGIEGALLCTTRGYPSYHFYRQNGFEDLDTMAVLVKA